MAVTTLPEIAIRAIAGAVPITTRVNAEIGGETEREYVEKLSRMVGVRSRRIVRDGQFGSDLGLAAARSAMDAVGWSAASIDLLIVATQTPDRLFPGISFLLHRHLGLSKSCPVFDINLGCSAFTHGVWAAGSLIQTVGKRALLVNVDTMSRTLGQTDYGNQVLFGDGAAATLLEVDPSTGPMTVALTSDGRGTEAVCLPMSAMSATHERPSFFINGPAVLGLALRSVPVLADSLLAAAGLQIKDIDMFVPHQANLFILDKLISRLGVENANTVVAMEDLGNTSSASIPLALCARRAAVEPAAKRHTMMVGFGTGFSLSGLIADLSSTLIVDPVDVV
jgi:3-oxoacyl-[acyl-carrier-protein] synthase-3